MIILCKIDWYTEFVILIAMVFSIPILFSFGFLMGLLILGSVQLISAALNTMACLHYGLMREIRKYWLFVGIDLVCLFIGAMGFLGSFSGLYFILLLGWRPLFLFIIFSFIRN